MIVQKLDFIHKFWVNFPNFKIKNFSVALFLGTLHMHLYMQVLLAVPFAVFVNGCFNFSWEINRVSKSFQVVNIKNACFSKLKTQCLRFETRFVGVGSVLLFSSHHAISSLALCNETKLCAFQGERIKFWGSGQDCQL